MKLPKSIQTDQTADLGVTISQKYFEKIGWKFRRQDGKNDFGVDSEVEICDKKFVTGKLLKCQIKGSKTITWENSTAFVQVKVSTYNLWKSINLPVIALLVDVNNENIYWCIPQTFVPKKEASTISLRFYQENILAETIDLLRSLIESWNYAFSDENIRREVPYYYQLFKELVEMIDWGDAWMMIIEEDDFKTRIFYKHVLQLRLSVGLLNDEIPRIDDWYIRSLAIWEDNPYLFHGVFSELMSYIKPFYEEAFKKLKKRVKNVELTFENSELISFFEDESAFEEGSDQTPNIGLTTYLDQRFSDNKFHSRFEEMLKNKNSLKYSYFNKKK